MFPSALPIAKTIKYINILALLQPRSDYRNCFKVLTAVTEITNKSRPVYPGMLPSFGASGARFSHVGARRNPVVRISVVAHRYRGEDQKKKKDVCLEI